MAVYTFRKRLFLNPVSTNKTSYIQAHVESSFEGDNKWGDNVLYIADCRHKIALEFCIGTKRHRNLSLKKINLLIDILSRFRDALCKEIALVDKRK